MQLITPLVAAAILASNVFAHPGQSTLELRQEIADRAEFMKHSKKDLSHCAAKMKSRGLEQRAIARRTATAKNERKKRSLAASKSIPPIEITSNLTSIDAPFLKARDAASVAATEHSSAVNYTASTDEATLFSGNSSCILSPEVTQGPYCKFNQPGLQSSINTFQM